MTVCVGLLHKDFCILASDSRGVMEDGRHKDNTQKLIDIPNGCCLAISGTLGSGQKFARLLVTHPNPLDVPFNEIPDEAPHCLYVTKDRLLLEIDSAFGVSAVGENDYVAIGIGCDIARTSVMKQLEKKKLSALDYKACCKIIENAIADACKLNIFCGGPIQIKVFKRG